MSKKPVYIFIFKDKEVYREEGLMINIYRGRRIIDQNKQLYEINTLEHILSSNTHICNLKEISKIVSDNKNKEKVIKEDNKEKVIKKDNKEKVIIQSRERLAEKNNKWSNWINNTPCSSLEDAESMLSDLKNAETDSLQFRICVKNKNKEETEEVKETKEKIKEEVKEEKHSEVIEKPFIIQYKERNVETNIFSGWKLLKRFETAEERNEYYSKMNKEKNKLYTIKNVRITRQHLNKLLEK